MDGIQKTVHDGLAHLADKVRSGLYGKDDDAFQDDTARDAFLEDLQDEVEGKVV